MHERVGIGLVKKEQSSRVLGKRARLPNVGKRLKNLHRIKWAVKRGKTCGEKRKKKVLSWKNKNPVPGFPRV